MSKKPNIIIGKLASNGTIIASYKDFKSGTYCYGPSLITETVGIGRVKVTVEEGKITIEKIEKEKPCQS